MFANSLLVISIETRPATIRSVHFFFRFPRIPFLYSLSAGVSVRRFSPTTPSTPITSYRLQAAVVVSGVFRGGRSESDLENLAFLSTMDDLGDHKTPSILDLPAELLVHVCRCDAIKLTDVFSLAVSHPKLNACLFGLPNSCLWKAKYMQKCVRSFACRRKQYLKKIFFVFLRYGWLDRDEYEIVIDKHNSWKDELRFRVVLEKAVCSEIKQFPFKFFRFSSTPYHLYPFGEELNSEYQSHRYYVMSAAASCYKDLLSHIPSAKEHSSSLMPFLFRFAL